MKINPYIILTLLIILFSCNTPISNKDSDSKTTSTEDKSKNEDLIQSKLFDVELVGLTKDDNEERYYVDFSSACMCNSPSILLKERKAYLFDFCKDTLPPLSKEPYYTYDIIESKEIDNGLSISLKNTNNEKLFLMFNKVDAEFIYKLKVIGKFPTDYIGNNVCEFFTYNLANFEIEDCGDFDG